MGARACRHGHIHETLSHTVEAHASYSMYALPGLPLQGPLQSHALTLEQERDLGFVVNSPLWGEELLGFERDDLREKG